jgi:hypothetical protein
MADRVKRSGGKGKEKSYVFFSGLRQVCLLPVDQWFSTSVGRDPLVGRVALPGGSWMLPQKAKKMIEVFFVGYFLLGYYFDAILCGLDNRTRIQRVVNL